MEIKKTGHSIALEHNHITLKIKSTVPAKILFRAEIEGAGSSGDEQEYQREMEIPKGETPISFLADGIHRDAFEGATVTWMITDTAEARTRKVYANGTFRVRQ